MSGKVAIGTGSGRDLIKRISVGTGSGMDSIKGAWTYAEGSWLNLWSGASLVTYYDGETLLGTAEVDEGQSVLNPSFHPRKNNKILYGWNTNPSATTPLNTLVADGEPITLYAIWYNAVASGTLSASIQKSGAQGGGTVTSTATLDTRLAGKTIEIKINHSAWNGIYNDVTAQIGSVTAFGTQVYYHDNGSASQYGRPSGVGGYSETTTMTLTVPSNNRNIVCTARFDKAPNPSQTGDHCAVDTSVTILGLVD